MLNLPLSSNEPALPGLGAAGFWAFDFFLGISSGWPPGPLRQLPP